MKSLIIAVTIAVLIIFGGIYATEKIEDVSNDLIKITEDANKAVQKDDYKKAGALGDELKSIVEKNYNVFASCVDHSELEKIDMNLDQMQVYIEERQKADSLAYINVLLGLFEHLPKDYKLKLENVF